MINLIHKFLTRGVSEMLKREGGCVIDDITIEGKNSIIIETEIGCRYELILHEGKDTFQHTLISTPEGKSNG